MFTRLRKSRGWGKFRRNRAAMVAVTIIALYTLLAGWIWAMEGAQWVGRQTGAWDLSKRPVLGLLLPQKTLERVGPRWLSGFGLEQPTARREDQADFLLKSAEEGLRAARRAAEAGGDGRAESIALALTPYNFAELRLADVPLDELERRITVASDAFKLLDGVKVRRGSVLKLVSACDAALQTAKRAADAGDEVDQVLRDDAAAAVEEVMFSIEDYQALPPIGEGDPLKDLDPAALQEAADAIRDGAGPITAPTDVIAEIRVKAREAYDAAEPEAAAALDRIEPAVAQIYPRPEGFDGALYAFRTSLGTDSQGRSIMIRALYSAKIAIQVGVVVAMVAVLIGAILGSAAAYFGGIVDHAVTWLYSTLSSMPQLVLLAVLAFMFLGTDYERTLIPVYAALCLTFWIGPCRVIRGETLKIKQLEYAQAATVIGFARPYILLRHVLPNTMHLMFINFSLLFIGAIKTEVVLTFLGLGIKEGASWGLMISQAAPEVVSGIFWQIGAATFFMLVLVLAFNVVSDALQDAFDPKHVG